MNEGLIDLHVHTTASDGTMTPEEVVIHARESGLKAIAITDHDTIDGVNEALSAGLRIGLEVVPGVEISADFPGEMHILGYFIDPADAKLRSGLAMLRRYREERNPKIAQKLRELGLDISINEVARAAGGGVIGRPHFAAVMMAKGYVRDIGEAFEKYLGTGRPAYVKKERLSPCESIGLVTAAGGIAVLAHPKFLQISDDRLLDQLVKELVEYGLRGIEVYYTSNTPEETRKYFSLASRYNLLVTGGTDFHGANKPEIRIGRGEEGLAIQYDILAKLKEYGRTKNLTGLRNL